MPHSVFLLLLALVSTLIGAGMVVLAVYVLHRYRLARARGEAVVSWPFFLCTSGLLMLAFELIAAAAFGFAIHLFSLSSLTQAQAAWWGFVLVLGLVTLWIIAMAVKSTRTVLGGDDPYPSQDAGTGRAVGAVGAAFIWAGVLVWLAVYALLIVHAMTL